MLLQNKKSPAGIEKHSCSKYNNRYTYAMYKGELTMPKSSSRKSKTINKNRIYVAVAAVILVAALAVGVFIFGKPKSGLSDDTTVSTTQQTTQTPTTQVETVKPTNPLTGASGLSDTAIGKRPIAVVVENSPSARPQWGLCSPDIVIEGVVEGGITRMLWLYADVNSIPKVGPMRSARHDFVEMAEGFNSIFIHWGGSTFAYDAIKARKVTHIDGMDGKYFYRDKSRAVSSEHTGYSNGESMAKAIKDKNFNTQIDSAYSAPFTFVEKDAPRTPAGGACQSVSFVFSSSYKHEFKYNAAEKLYYNYMNSKPMVQDGGKQMAVTNTIVLYCPVAAKGTSSGHMEMDLTGGTGLYASNGSQEAITWKKGGPSAMLRLFAADGTELLLNPGKSYIGFVPAAQSGNTVIKTG